MHYTDEDVPIQKRQTGDTYGTNKTTVEAIWDGFNWIWKDTQPNKFERLMHTPQYISPEKWEEAKVAMAGDIETNAKGGKQSRLDTRFDLVPFSAIFEAAKVLKTGADKYGVDNWRKIPVESHLNHALEHIYRYLEEIRLGISDPDEDYELGHALCRLMFAVAIDQDGEDE